MSRIIGVCGKKRSGKDTIAEYLKNNYSYETYSFASPMKEACKEIFLLSDDQVYGDKKAEVDDRWGISPRKLLQIMGTELFQYDIHNYTEEDEFDIGRQIWVKRFEVWYNEKAKGDVVISDVRFHHEANKIREMGGEIWKVERYSTEEGDDHPSEKELETIEGDHHIQNFGTIPQLYDQIGAIFQKD